MKIIQTFDYKKEKLHKIGSAQYGRNWPVVYILEGTKEAYVGETTDAFKRSNQHIKREERRKLNRIHIIGDKKFNKSAVLDIEAQLISFMSADGKYVLQNGNGGLQNHRYYNKELYHDVKFEIIWKALMEKGLAINSLIQIKNSDIFKFSPYKALTDDQLEVAKAISKDIVTLGSSHHLIKGEPGSGKTILAVFLVKYLMQMPKLKGKEIGLVIPMTSLRKTLKAVFKSVKGLKANMILGPNDVVKNDYDILIVDEAHRLTRRKGIVSFGAFDDVNKKNGWDKYKTSQLDWIERSAKHVVLFYDKNQSVKPADIPKERFAEFSGKKYVLKSQMRVLGGSDYISYIDNILNNKQKEKKGFDNYDLKMFEDIGNMVEMIKRKNGELGLSRMVAGFAWDWISKNDKSKKDIVIDGYGLMWNSVTMDWVNSENAIHEVGCIHSIQGYDLNYTGVIIGSEFGMKKDKFFVNKDKYRDKKGKFDIKNPDQLINYVKNIYKVLLTRGIRGTYLYICDKELREYFRKFVDVFDGEGIYKELDKGLRNSRDLVSVAERKK